MSNQTLKQSKLSQVGMSAKVHKMRKIIASYYGTATAPVRFEAQITDAYYAAEILSEDIKNKRVWFDTPANAQGWMKLLYSADGQTGDPFPIGRIRIYLDLNDLGGKFENISQLAMLRSK